MLGVTVDGAARALGGPAGHRGHRHLAGVLGANLLLERAQRSIDGLRDLRPELPRRGPQPRTFDLVLMPLDQRRDVFLRDSRFAQCLRARAARIDGATAALERELPEAPRDVPLFRFYEL